MEENHSPIQFSVSQLLWAIALVAVWFYSVHVSLTNDLRRPPEPDWIFTILATPPIAGGLIGLIRNKTKGMVIGIGVGVLSGLLIFALLILVCLLGFSLA